MSATNSINSTDSSTSSAKASSSIEADLVTLVDEQDRVVGTAERSIAHRGKGLLHRAASVFLFRKTPAGVIEVLLQQRSQFKIVAANLWANTACGNCRPTETALACIQRRLREELGVVGVELTPIARFIYQVACEPGWSEHEYDHFFAGWYDGPILLNADETQAVDWVRWSESLENLDRINAKKPLAPWMPVFMNLPILRQGLIQWLQTTSSHD